MWQVSLYLQKPNLLNLQTDSINNNNSYRKIENDISLVEQNIAVVESKMNRKKILDNFIYFSQNPDRVNLNQIWKVLDKISPKYLSNIPVAKYNHQGKIISSPLEMKQLLSREYKDRLRTRPVRPDMGNIRERRKYIFEYYLNLAKQTKTRDFMMNDLEMALSNLN